MKEDSNSKNPDIDPELEARIVALVLGEASDLESDGLSRLIEEHPALAAFQEQMQSMHGLLQDVSTGESVEQEDDWKLPTDKRSKVLAVIGGDSEPQSANPVLNLLAEKSRSVSKGFFWTYSKIAAVICVVGSVATLATLGVFLSLESKDAPTEVASRSNTRRSIDVPMPHFADPDVRSSGIAHPSKARIVMSDGAATTSENEGWVLAPEERVDVEFDYEEDSKSSLSSIRDSLGVDAESSIPLYAEDYERFESVSPHWRFSEQPSAPSGSSDAGVEGRISTEAVPGGNEPLARSYDMNGPVGGDEGGWAYQPDTNSDGTNDAISIPNDGKMAFPILADKDGEVSRHDVRELAESVRSITRSGNQMLGLESSVSGPGPGEIRFESPATSRVRRNDDDENVDRAQVSNGNAYLDFDNRRYFGLESKAALSFAEREPGSKPEGEAQASTPQQPKFEAGTEFNTELNFLAESTEPSAVAGKDVDRVARARDWGDEATSGYRMLDGGFGGGSGGGGSVGSGGLGINGTTDGVWWESAPLAMPTPAKPVPPVTNGMLEADKAKALSDYRNSEDGLASIIPDLSVQLQSSKDQLNKQLQDAGESGAAELVEDRTTVPDEEDLALEGGRIRTRGMFNGRQIPLPITGTVIAAPADELKAGQKGTDYGLSLEYGSKPPLTKLPALGRLFKNTWDETDSTNDVLNGHIVKNWSRPQPVPEGIQDQFFRFEDQSPAADSYRWGTYVPPNLVEKSKSIRKSWAKKSIATTGLDEKTAEDEAFSTFSLHVSDVSFKLALAALAQGEWPEPAKIRIEEFVNALDYGDPMPCRDEKVSCRLEQTIHPFLQQRNLMRVSMKTAAAGRSSKTPLRLTFLLDNSGSMERVDRQQTVRRAFALLAQQLKPIDQVTLISFARQPRLLADKVGGAQSNQLVEMIENLPSEGGTNIEAALQLAFEKAKDQQIDVAQNRIILLTDGAVNLGDANPDSLSQIITRMRDSGIAFDAAGISAEGLNDEVLEALARKGDGRYYLLDSIEAADDGFARQIAGALRPSAKNVKVQIEFNPRRVGRYKLLGFEKHRLKQEDFRNDSVDAAEMAAAEAGVAVYQFEARPDGEGDVGSVSVRFRDLSTGQMIENCWPIPYEADAPRVDGAAPSLRIATSAALLAAKLRGEPLGETVDLKTLSNLISSLPDQYRSAKRVIQLQQMIGQARQLSGQ